MQIQRITQRLDSRANSTLKKTFQSQNKNDETEYVKIPKKKYQRDQVLTGILLVWLLVDLIRDFLKPEDEITKFLKDFFKGKKPPR